MLDITRKSLWEKRKKWGMRKEKVASIAAG